MLLFKTLIIGDAGAGKTSLMNNYLGRPFRESDPPTIGVEFGSNIIDLGKLNADNAQELLEQYREQLMTKYPDHTLSECYSKVKCQIWDTSGQERFHSIVKSYYRGVHAVIFVCDLTRRNSFENLDYWVEDFKRNTTIPYDKAAKIIVATKSDLESNRVLTDEELEEYSDRMDIPYYIVSSKTGSDKIRTVFDLLALQTFEKYLQRSPEDRQKMECISSLMVPPAKSTTDCCIIL